MKLEGKIAIVTGGAVRLGRAIALALADEGASIALHYGRSADAARETLAEIHARGVAGSTIQADLARPVEASKTVIERTISEFGRADILINSAAIFEEDRLATISDEDWERCLAINLKGPLFLCQQFASRLQPGQRAHIVNLADWRALRPQGDHLVYTVSKAGLVTLTKSLALHLAPDVQVNAVAPGAILPAPGVDQREFDALAEQIPLRRTGSPDDVTRAVVFLLRSDFITGEVILVTGGES